MNKKRILHAVMMALSVAGAVCVALEKLPRWAAAASVALALVTNLEKVVGAIDATAGLTVVFMGLLLGHALYGCATTSKVVPIVKSCEPTTDQQMALLEAAAKPTQAEALAAIDALGFALCVLQKGADEAITALTPKPGTAALALTAQGYSPVLDNLRAWRAAHP